MKKMKITPGRRKSTGTEMEKCKCTSDTANDDMVWLMGFNTSDKTRKLG